MINPDMCLGPRSNDTLANNMVNLVNTSITASTWAVYNSGWNNFKAFELYEGKSIPLPLDIKTFRAYVTWSLTVKKLKVSTVKLYISSLKLAHAIQGYDTDNIFRDKLSELILAGAENTEPLNVCSRRAMTIDILMILGHKIALTDWSKLSKLCGQHVPPVFSAQQDWGKY
jgi:hypothetical protein